MIRRLNSIDGSFEADFAAFAKRPRGTASDAAVAVASIIADVRANGFDALRALTAKYDNFQLSVSNIAVTPLEIEAAESSVDAAVLEALALAASRIEAYHQKQIPEDCLYTDEQGVRLGWRWTPVESAGLYAPGGRAAYPSSVLMNAIPAAVAGVKRICLCTPAPDGVIDPLVLAAARLAGVDEIYRVGGAQAIAAMAWGAGPIAPVDLIVGPGNDYVAEAKRQVFGRVGIDAIAGPSEILVVADAANDPDWIAADLLSQAEHDPSSQCVLITDDAAFAQRVATTAAAQISTSPRRAIMEAAWRDNAAIMVLESLDDAPDLVNRLAPEHVELAIDNPEALAGKIRNAGALFLGRYAPEAIGDYVAGPNHVLPTSFAARYASGLSVLNFMKRTSIIGCDQNALAKIGPSAAMLADAEGLPAHAASVRLRLPPDAGPIINRHRR